MCGCSRTFSCSSTFAKISNSTTSKASIFCGVLHFGLCPLQMLMLHIRTLAHIYIHTDDHHGLHDHHNSLPLPSSPSSHPLPSSLLPSLSTRHTITLSSSHSYIYTHTHTADKATHKNKHGHPPRHKRGRLRAPCC